VPRPGANPGPLTQIRFGAADAHSGVNWSSLSVTADFVVNGRAAGAQLADLATAAGDGIYTIALSPPVAATGNTVVHVAVADQQGNIARVHQRFSVQNGPAATPTSTPSGASATPTRTPPASATRTTTRTATVPLTAALSGRISYYRADQPVAGVDVGGVRSDSDGSYGLAASMGSALTLTPQRLGGSGRAVSSLDAAYVLQATAGQRTFDAMQALSCDATGNGALTPLDATRILQLVVGLRSRLPVGELCASDWAFFPNPAAAPNQQSIAPSLQGGVCRRGAIAFTPVAAAAAQQDFRASAFGDCTGNWQAPAQSAALRHGSRRVRLGPPIGSSRRFLRLPIEVTGVAAFSALELTLRFDPAALRLRTVRPFRRSDGVIVSVNPEQGNVRVALASGVPLSRVNGRLVATFERLQLDAHAAMSLLSARVDE
jgi:hypothetical protein